MSRLSRSNPAPCGVSFRADKADYEKAEAEHHRTEVRADALRFSHLRPSLCYPWREVLWQAMAFMPETPADRRRAAYHN